jgi:gliding motility-associated-like protein
MILDIIAGVVASAGPDISTCETSPILISGATAANYSSIVWTTSGSGTFSNATALNPVYTPGTADVNIGLVILTMHVTGISPCAETTDNLRLTLVKGPVANAGEDAATCYGTPFSVTTATALNYSSVNWTFVPADAGQLTGGNTISPVFTPKAGFEGTVTFTLSVTGSSACGSTITTDQFVLTVGNKLTVNAGSDITIPKGSAASFTGTATGGSGFYAWSWEPANLFVNPNIYNPVSVPLFDETVFILKVLDMNIGCIGTDTVKVMMGAAISPPVANIDYDTTVVNIPTTIHILGNDQVQSGTKLTVSFCSYPEHGVVILNSDKTITYTPYPDYTGDDVFCYTLCDNNYPPQCDTALVKIHIKPRDIDDIDPTGTVNYPDNQVLIFNRWGDHVRKFAGYDNHTKVWDGTNDDFQNLPDGTYYYIIKITNVGAKTGWIYIRNNK